MELVKRSKILAGIAALFIFVSPVYANTNVPAKNVTVADNEFGDNAQTAFDTIAADLPVSGAAPANGVYILGHTNSSLPDAQSIGGLTSGILLNTVSGGTGTLSRAVPGTDYLAPNSLITGATHTKITYDGHGLVTAGADATTSDIPEGSNLYFTPARARASVSSSATGLSYDSSTGIFSLTSGYVIPTTTEETNWNTAYTDRITSAGGTAPMTLGVLSNVLSGSMTQADTSTDGWLSHTDWNTFNGKDAVIVAGTGLDRTVNTLSVKTSQNISTLSNLTTNGHIQTSGSTGALSVDTTAYVPQTTTVNSHALSSNVTVTQGDVGLGNVTNNAQVKKSSSSTNGDLIIWNGTTGDAVQDGYAVVTTLADPGSNSNIPTEAAVRAAIAGSGGDVTGPGSSIAHNFSSFANTSGKLLEDSGKSAASFEVPLTFSTGVTRTVNTVTVNTSQNISTLSNLTSNGHVQTSGGTGALSIDTTVYTPTSRTVTGTTGVSGGGDLSANRTFSLAPATYTGNQVWDDGSTDPSITVKYDLSGSTDPTWSYSNGVANLSTGALQVGGSAVLTANQGITLSGDVTGTGSTGITTTISSGAVTLADMANLAANSIIGNNTSSPATPLALTITQTKTLLALNNVVNVDQTNGSNISTGTVAMTVGGTGQGSYTDGQLLIGNTTGNTIAKATLTQGTGMTITNGHGTITLANAGVTSLVGTGNQVNVSGSTGSITLSTPQNIDSTATPTFGGMTLTSALTQPNGGTGRASSTAYAVVCGGATTTAAQQSIASVGTAGQVLTSNGAAALPSFQNVTTGRLLSVETFSSSGTWTKPAGCNQVIVEVQGPGGNGGAAGGNGGGGGGGGGGYSKKFITSSLGATETVTVGTSSGTDSSFGSWATGASGSNGTSGGTLAAPPGAGGAGSSGDINTTGQSGGFGVSFNVTPNYMGAMGGNSTLGFGGNMTATPHAGQAGAGYGGGGAGGTGSGSQAGGAGAPGIVIVWEYS